MLITWPIFLKYIYELILYTVVLSCIQSGVNFIPKDSWQCLEAIFYCHKCGVLLLSASR